MHGACAPNYFCNCGRLSLPLQIPLYWIWCECQSALVSVVNNALYISNISSRVLALAAMSLAYNAILCLYSKGIYLSIAVWNAMCCTWLAGRQPIVSLLQANMHHCIWNAISFLDSSSSGMEQNAFIAFNFKKNLKAFSFLISSVARGSILATDFKQCLISAWRLLWRDRM